MPSAQELQCSSRIVGDLRRWHEGASGLPACRYAPQDWQSVERVWQHGECRILSITSLRSSGVLQNNKPERRDGFLLICTACTGNDSKVGLGGAV